MSHWNEKRTNFILIRDCVSSAQDKESGSWKLNQKVWSDKWIYLPIHTALLSNCTYVFQECNVCAHFMQQCINKMCRLGMVLCFGY